MGNDLGKPAAFQKLTETVGSQLRRAAKLRAEFQGRSIPRLGTV